MLNKENDGECKSPITENGEQVVNDFLQHITATIGECKCDETQNCAPEEPRNSNKMFAKELHAKRAGVNIRNRVANCFLFFN